MYSLTGRANTVFFNVLITLSILSSINYLSVRFNEKKPTDVEFKFHALDTFTRDSYIKEEAASFTFDLKADFGPMMDWNTNIVFAYITCEFKTDKSEKNFVTIWDRRIGRFETEEQWIDIKRALPEYYLTDINKELKNKEVEVYLNWEVMPTVGLQYRDKVLLGKI